MNWKINGSFGFTPLEKVGFGAAFSKTFNSWGEEKENYFLTGFTLLELLIVMVLISLLTGIGALTYTNAQRSGRDSKRQADLRRLQSALELFYADNHFYPNLTDCASGWEDADNLGEDFLITTEKKYTEDIPKDPKDVAYKYCARDSSSGKYLCYCLSGKMEKPENGNTAEGDCSRFDPTPDPGDEYNYTITCP